jgi:hypothetical protein
VKALKRCQLRRHLLYGSQQDYDAMAGKPGDKPTMSCPPRRLVRMVHRLMPADSAVIGLLALMLLTDARRRPGEPPTSAAALPPHESSPPGRRRVNDAALLASVSRHLR